MGIIIKEMLKMVTKAAQDLFDGSQGSIDLLHGLITNGALLQTSLNTSLGYQDYVNQAVYAWLIPEAWKLGQFPAWPVVLDAGIDCNAPVYDVNSPIYSYIETEEDAKAAWVCYKSSAYYLVGAYGLPYENPSSDGGIGYVPNYFSINSGQKLLMPDTPTFSDNYAGVTQNNFVSG